jgi:hypothetical protein
MTALAAHPETTAVYTFFYTPPFAADESCLNWDNAQRTRDAGASACVYPGSCCPAKQGGSGNMVEWQGFVSQVVTRAAGRIKSYELWNEPVLSATWQGR